MPEEQNISEAQPDYRAEIGKYYRGFDEWLAQRKRENPSFEANVDLATRRSIMEYKKDGILALLLDRLSPLNPDFPYNAIRRHLFLHFMYGAHCARIKHEESQAKGKNAQEQRHTTEQEPLVLYLVGKIPGHLRGSANFPNDKDINPYIEVNLSNRVMARMIKKEIMSRPLGRTPASQISIIHEHAAELLEIGAHEQAHADYYRSLREEERKKEKQICRIYYELARPQPKDFDPEFLSNVKAALDMDKSGTDFVENSDALYHASPMEIYALEVSLKVLRENAPFARERIREIEERLELAKKISKATISVVTNYVDNQDTKGPKGDKGKSA